jgi:hypothetical protein
LLFFEVCLFQLCQEPSHYSRLSWACMRTNVLPLVCRNSYSFHIPYSYSIYPCKPGVWEDAIREEPQIYTLLAIFTLISLIFLGSLLIAQIAGTMRELGSNHRTTVPHVPDMLKPRHLRHPRPAVDYSWLYSVV